MNAEELRVILEAHRKWLNDEAGGKRANLNRADLNHANLNGANLSRADLNRANLKSANLNCANLNCANLNGADLNHANLNCANLNGADLKSANLNGADLKSANLNGANLNYANLDGADLDGANLDYSCLPLWCGSLKVHFDDRQIIQILYHLLSAASYSKNVCTEIKELLLTAELCELANKFHRVDECGEIEALKKETRPTDVAVTDGK